MEKSARFSSGCYVETIHLLGCHSEATFVGVDKGIGSSRSVETSGADALEMTGTGDLVNDCETTEVVGSGAGAVNASDDACLSRDSASDMCG